MTDLLPDTVDEARSVERWSSARVATVEWARTCDDPAEIWREKLKADAITRVLDDAKARDEMRRCSAELLVEVGRAIGPGPGHGPGRGINPPNSGGLLIPGQRRSEARLLHEWYSLRADPEIIDGVEAGRAVHVLLRMIAERTPVVPIPPPDDPEVWADVSDDERWRVTHGDFRDVADTMPAGSVDLIVTDPPYPAEHLILFRDLARVARRLLNQRGLLFVMTGNIFLPDVLGHLGEHMTWGWQFCQLMPGANSRIMGRHVEQAWKPILAYSTGTWPAGGWRSDVLRGGGRDQAEFAWGQSVEPMRSLIETYSRPNALVMDPMCGGGAFGVAAIEAGRRFLGVEIDEKQAGRARERITR
jgi:site-specific DNA-methyltransferase (adenine-specific)